MDLLALDLSSSVCGYTIIIDNKIEKVSYKKFETKEMLTRGKELINLLYDITEQYPQVKTLVIEAHMKSFAGGASSSDAMLKTSQMNFLGQSYLYNFHDYEVITLNVNHARNTWQPGFLKLARAMKGVKHKEIAFNIAKDQFKELGIELPTKVISRGKRKGETVYLDEAGDMTDSYILAMSYLKENS